METKITMCAGDTPAMNVDTEVELTRTVHIPIFKSSQVNKRMDKDFMETGEIIPDNEVLTSNMVALAEGSLSAFENKRDTIIFICIRQKIENDYVMGMVSFPINEEGINTINIKIPEIDIKPQISISGKK